ncbi:MAG: AMP-binding protein [Betaproteobacteria bacterium]
MSDGTLPPTLRSVIEEQARVRPDAVFLVDAETGSITTYAALHRSVQALAGELAQADVVVGDVVSTMLPNGSAAIHVFLGAMFGGHVVSPINLLAQDAQLEHVLTHSGTRMVFVAPEHAERLAALAQRVAPRVRIRITDPHDLAPASVAAAPAAHVASDDAALLMYTSGTTGLPKGVLLTHGNVLAAGRAVAAAQALTDQDRVLSALPLYHINGQCIATVAPLVSGGSIVLPSRFSVSQWWPLVEQFRPTWLNLVPTMIAYLSNGADLTPAQREACRGLRFARSASAPLPPEQHRAFEQRFGVSIIEAMGLTESASVAFTNPLDPADRKLGSPGRPLAVEARVVAPDGRERATGEAGEIQLRGAPVMQGYFRAAELTAQALDANGWLATGDLGYRDPEGFYFITGRLKELIIKGGENIAPREIDEALLAHPAVLEAAAVGIPDTEYGQEILACVVLKANAQCTEAELRAHCLRVLGRYKSPKVLRFVADLPKGPSGKVQRMKLL